MALLWYVLTATHLLGTDVIVNLPHGLLTETGSLDVTLSIHMASLISTEGHGSMNENRRYSGSCLLLAGERNFHHHLSAVVTCWESRVSWVVPDNPPAERHFRLQPATGLA
jgi:hypothetical protein